MHEMTYSVSYVRWDVKPYSLAHSLTEALLMVVT